MGEAKHTPGPWINAATIITGSHEVDGLPVRRVVARTSMRDGIVNQQQQDDAEFIVRAANCHDDLLAACETARARFDSLNSQVSEQVWNDNYKTICILDSAISKAKGATP